MGSLKWLTSFNSQTAQERWNQFSVASVRAFHRYATWLVSLSWWRFGWYALLLIIVTGLIQKLPPFSMTYYETIVESVRHRKPKAPTRLGADPGPPPPRRPRRPPSPSNPKSRSGRNSRNAPRSPRLPPRPCDAKGSKAVDIKLPGIIVNTKDHTIKNKGVNITFTGNGIHITSDEGRRTPRPPAPPRRPGGAGLARRPGPPR